MFYASSEMDFVFSLMSNGRLKQLKKFQIKQDLRDWAFLLHKQEHGVLFAIGGTDICIAKEDFKNKCWCKQFCFNYEGKQKVLVGKEGENNPFTVKRIIVWQMK